MGFLLLIIIYWFPSSLDRRFDSLVLAEETIRSLCCAYYYCSSVSSILLGSLVRWVEFAIHFADMNRISWLLGCFYYHKTSTVHFSLLWSSLYLVPSPVSVFCISEKCICISSIIQMCFLCTLKVIPASVPDLVSNDNLLSVIWFFCRLVHRLIASRKKIDDKLSL